MRYWAKALGKLPENEGTSAYRFWRLSVLYKILRNSIPANMILAFPYLAYELASLADQRRHIVVASTRELFSMTHAASTLLYSSKKKCRIKSSIVVM